VFLWGFRLLSERFTCLHATRANPIRKDFTEETPLEWSGMPRESVNLRRDDRDVTQTTVEFKLLLLLFWDVNIIMEKKLKTAVLAFALKPDSDEKLQFGESGTKFNQFLMLISEMISYDCSPCP
jgi:hypothetical protein